jgi:hypothetical protein
MEGKTIRLSALFVCLLALAAGCESKKEVAQAASADGQPWATASDGKLTPACIPGSSCTPGSACCPAVPPEAKKPVEAVKTDAAPSHAAAALQSAMDQKKYLFVSFSKAGDPKGEEIRKTFADAQSSLSQKAIFYTADVADPKEQVLVTKYQVSRAPLPLTIAFAENGAIVKAFPGKTMGRDELEKSFVSPKMAEVQKGFQDRKIILLCTQGKSTQHNAESLGAARELAQDEKNAKAINLMEVAPEDTASADLLKQLKVDSTLKEATVFVLIPPSTLAGKVEGATTKDALWKVVLKGVSSCGSGCGPSGCGPSAATAKK